MSDLLTPAEAAEYLRVSERTIKTLRLTGRLAFVDVAGKVRITRQAVADYLIEHERRLPPPSHDRPMTPPTKPARRRTRVDPSDRSDLRVLWVERQRRLRR